MGKDELDRTDQRAPVVRSGQLRKQGQRAFFRIYLLQCGLAVLLAALFLLSGWPSAYSALLGGVIYLLPNVVFTWQVFSGPQTGTAGQVVARLYRSEIGKMLMVALLFSATFILVHPLSPFPLFLTFIILQVSGWVLQMKMNKRFLKL